MNVTRQPKSSHNDVILVELTKEDYQSGFEIRTECDRPFTIRRISLSNLADSFVPKSDSSLRAKGLFCHLRADGINSSPQRSRQLSR